MMTVFAIVGIIVLICLLPQILFVIGAFCTGVFFLIAGIVSIPFYLLAMLAKVMEKFVDWFNRWSGAGY